MVRDGDTVVAAGPPRRGGRRAPGAGDRRPRPRRRRPPGYDRLERRRTRFPPASCAAPTATTATACGSSPGALGDGRFAADWTPDASLADDGGAVRPECVWAALDCPTSAPVANWGEGPPMVLARLAASIERRRCGRRAARAGLLGARAATGASARPRACCFDARRRGAGALARGVDRAARGVGCRTVATATTTHYRTCPVLRGHLRPGGRRSTAARSSSVRGDDEDVFSHGFLCPKATGLEHLHADPDRLRTPLVRSADGELRRGRRGTRRFARSTAPLPHPRRARPRRGRRLPRQPERAQPVGADSTGRCCCARSARATSTRPARSTRCRSRSRPG